MNKLGGGCIRLSIQKINYKAISIMWRLIDTIKGIMIINHFYVHCLDHLTGSEVDYSSYSNNNENQRYAIKKLKEYDLRPTSKDTILSIVLYLSPGKGIPGSSS